jgi:hypothetical protein
MEHHELIASAMYIYYLYRRIVFEVFAEFGNVYIHAAGIEVGIVQPYLLQGY